MGRLNVRYCAGSVGKVTFAYDDVGNRILMADKTGRYTSTYDALDRPQTITSPGGLRITYAYDGAGQRSVMTAPWGGRFTYSWDAAGGISRIVNPQAKIVTYAYDAASRRTVKRLGNGSRTSLSYDSADRVTRIANIKSSGVTISRFDYAYLCSCQLANDGGNRFFWIFREAGVGVGAWSGAGSVLAA